MGITGNFCLIAQERPKLIILILTWLSLGFTVWEAARTFKYAVSLDSKIVNGPKEILFSLHYEV